MSSTYTAQNAAAYEQLMGRWSPLLADALIAFAGLDAGESVLDLGCGTGSLALALARRPEPRRILGIDIAEPYVDHAASRSADPRLAFRTGDATALDLADASSDRSFSLLALNFMPAPARALAELRRVTRPGGTIPAAVWDFCGGLVYQRIFWDTAAALDPNAARARGRHLSSPLTRAGELEAAFAAAGLVDVNRRQVTLRDLAELRKIVEPTVEAEAPGPGNRTAPADAPAPAKRGAPPIAIRRARTQSHAGALALAA